MSQLNQFHKECYEHKMVFLFGADLSHHFFWQGKWFGFGKPKKKNKKKNQKSLN